MSRENMDRGRGLVYMYVCELLSMFLNMWRKLLWGCSMCLFVYVSMYDILGVLFGDL